MFHVRLSEVAYSFLHRFSQSQCLTNDIALFIVPFLLPAVVFRMMEYLHSQHMWHQVRVRVRLHMVASIWGRAR